MVASSGAILGSGITRSAWEGRYPVRKKPAAAQRCQQGARADGPPPGLKAGGPSQVWSAAWLRSRIPPPPSPPPSHSHLVTSPPSRPAPEVCGAGAERGGECGSQAWAWGLAGRA